MAQSEVNEKKRIIELVLGISKDNSRVSTMVLSLQNARNSCGYREEEPYTRLEFDLRGDGRRTNDEADIFNALLNYLIVLEQVGVLFFDGGIKETINEFYLANDDERKNALKGLRNALAHHGGLAIWDDKRKTGYKFMIDLSDSKEIVKLADKKWTGDYFDKSKETSTIIYAIPFIRLVENIVAQLKENIDEFVTKSTLSTEQIKTKFTILK